MKKSAQAASLKAFHIAQILARERTIESTVTSMDFGYSDEPHDGIEAALSRIRRVLMDTRRSHVTYEFPTDYDGSQLGEKLFGDGDTDADYIYQIDTREEAAYLYGVAVGMLLGKGGAR